MKIRPFIITAFLALAVPALAVGQDATVRHGVIPGGYDPVAFQTEGKVVRGKIKFNHVQNGKIYIFATRQNRDRFILEPGKYETSTHAKLQADIRKLINT